MSGVAVCHYAELYAFGFAGCGAEACVDVGMNSFVCDHAVVVSELFCLDHECNDVWRWHQRNYVNSGRNH